MPIADCLRHCLLSRSVKEGLSLLSSAVAQIDAASSTESDLIDLLVEVAIWIDFDFSLRDHVEQAIKRWPEASRGGSLVYRHGLLLRFIEATLAMHKEEFDEAVPLFEKTIAESGTLLDGHLCLICNFFAARCRYYQSRYAEAEVFVEKAYSQGSQLTDAVLQTAGVDILKSRIVLKQDPLHEAVCKAAKLLDNATAAFEPTDDHVTKGNIMAFRAQIAKRGPHVGEDAIDLLNAAIAEFHQHPRTGHPAEGRARLYRARLARDYAIDLAKQVKNVSPPKEKEELLVAMLKLAPRLLKAISMRDDLFGPFQDIVSKMQAFIDSTTLFDKGAVVAAEAKIHNLRQNALADLREASQIFRGISHFRSLANTCTTRGYILLDMGAYTEAAVVAREAIEYSAGKNPTVQARAWILATAIACVAFEEDMQTVDPAEHAQRAREFSTIALGHALKTDARLEGLAYLMAARALLLGGPLGADRLHAEQYRDQAKKILRKNPGGSLQRNFEILEAKLNPGGKDRSALRNFLEAGRPTTLAELEDCLVRVGWDFTGTIAEFMELFDLGRHQAEDRLRRACIDRRNVPKREIRQERQTRLSVSELKRHHAG